MHGRNNSYSQQTATLECMADMHTSILQQWTCDETYGNQIKIISVQFDTFEQNYLLKSSYQCSKMSFFFLSTINTVSPSCKTLLNVYLQQYNTTK